MALKDIWTPKKDGVDDVLAEHINGIADAVIENEKKIYTLEKEVEKEIIVDAEMSDISENPVQNKVVKFYIDDSVEISKQFEVVCAGELDETTGGVTAIKAEITEDISKMREFNFYVEFPVTEENAVATPYINANINGAPAGNNSFCSIQGLRAGVAGNIYQTMAMSVVLSGVDGQYVLSMQKPIQEKQHMGTNTRTNAQSASAKWIIPKNTTLYLNINNTVQFLSGTKWRLEGR